MINTGYKGQFYKYDYDAHTYKGEVAQMDICPECYDKTCNLDLPETNELPIEAEKKTDSNKSVFKELGKALEELDPLQKKKPDKKEKKKTGTIKKKTDPDEDWKPGRSKNLDDGKIWALYTAKCPWTLEEIADEMGCSPNTIYNHLKRMRKEKGLI